MSGTDPGLFGITPKTEPRDESNAHDSTELEESDRSLARELLDAKVGRIHVHPIERPESAGFSAVAYRSEAHRPPRPSEEYPTLPDAKVLVNVTQPLGPAPLAALRAANVPTPSGRASREAPTEPGQRRFDVEERKRSEGPSAGAPLVVPMRRVRPLWLAAAAAGLVASAVLAVWSLRNASTPVQSVKPAGAESSMPVPQVPLPAASTQPAPVAATEASIARDMQVAPAAAPARLSRPRAAVLTPQLAPVASAKAGPAPAPDPDLPPVKLLDEK